MLDLVENVPVVCSGNSFSVIADKDIQLVRAIWHQLYDRLGLDVPFSRFASSGNCTAAGRRLTFGWVESIPSDLGFKTCWPISSRFLFRNCQERCDQGPQLRKESSAARMQSNSFDFNPCLWIVYSGITRLHSTRMYG